MVGKCPVAIPYQNTPGAYLNVKAAATLNVIEIVFSITIEIRPHDLGERILVFSRGRLRTKSGCCFLGENAALAVSQIHCDCIRWGKVGSGDVWIAVMIEVAHSNGVREGAAAD